MIFNLILLSILQGGMPRSNMDGAVGGTENKSFCSKSGRGWSHSDNVITNEGIAFNVRVKRKYTNYSLCVAYEK